jgi:divalent metal cation (Fe/Co/Zn/Cd) transporter
VADVVRDAIRISWICVGWSLAAGAASLAVALTAGSLSLGGLGASVLVDVVSSAVLIWRFRRQRAGAEFPEQAERRAQIVASAGLLVIAVVLTVEAVRHLIDAAHPTVPAAALGLAAANLVVLPLLARRKYAVARAVGSLALRTDAHITMVGAGTAVLTLVGLGADRAFGWWWSDAAAALVIAVVAADQGRRSILEVRGS